MDRLLTIIQRLPGRRVKNLPKALAVAVVLRWIGDLEPDAEKLSR